LIISDIANPFFPEVARGIENKIKDHGYSLIFCNTDNKNEEEKNAINLLMSKQVDGITLSLSMKNKDQLNRFEEEQFPVVQIDRYVPDSGSPAVTVNNIASAYNATKYLIDLGHKKIAHITGDLETKTACDRLQGFKKALRGAGIEQRDEWLLKGDYSKQSGYDQMNALLKLKEKNLQLSLSPMI